MTFVTKNMIIHFRTKEMLKYFQKQRKCTIPITSLGRELVHGFILLNSP